ncbi:response regulator [Konateibacter massiliensis]|uniref:response regulator n=1 Tax=Konateibacter massiliensis TaxID=2002841 RepID=UPI001F33B21D|nr:response regulator [Konateibacter massiliensis]
MVEDEIVVREGIKNNIDWEREGFEFVGEASDGELAYPMIRNLKPDILITDIKMPFMDGLELSKMVKKEYPSIKIIILSGYNEFEYAKQAIQIGVTDYLLKPISSVKLMEAIGKVRDMIAKEAEEKKLLELYKKEMEEKVVHEKKNFFFEIIQNKLSLPQMIEKGDRLGIDLAAGAYSILLLKISVRGSSFEYSANLIKAREELNILLQNNSEVIEFECENEIIAVILKAKNEEALETLRSKYHDKILEILEEKPELEYFGGIGSIVLRISELQDSYYIANKAFSARYFTKTNQILKGDKLIKWNTYSHDSIDMQAIDAEKMNKAFLERFMKNGSKEEIANFVEEYFVSSGHKNMKSILFRQYAILNIYFCVVSFLESIGYSKEKVVKEMEGFQDLDEIIASVETSKTYMEKLFYQAFCLRDAAARQRYGDVLKTAKEYIEENYHKEDISLNTVASIVNISPTYFSAIFSQEMGQTFIEFLTETRMDKAKELLMCSNKKTTEIGFEVGYKDSHYFSYIFKKTQQCTPKEYRMRGRA